MTAVAEPPSAPSTPLTDEEFAALAEEVAERNKPKLRPARVVLQVFLITVAILWLIPIVLVLQWMLKLQIFELLASNW